jgi:hypothetical protein
MSNVHALQFFELLQQLFGLGGVVTVAFELRDAITLTAYVSLSHRNVPFCSLQVPFQHLAIDRTKMIRAMPRIFLLLPETIAGIGDLPARAGKQVHVDLQELVRSSPSFFDGHARRIHISTGFLDLSDNAFGD